jgi:hypothetical protein
MPSFDVSETSESENFNEGDSFHRFAEFEGPVDGQNKVCG